MYETTHEIVSDEEHGKGSGNKRPLVHFVRVKAHRWPITGEVLTMRMPSNASY